MAPVQFAEAPRAYLRWAARQKPAIFWSCVIGSVGPVMFFVVPPVRRYFGDFDPELIPQTYPIPPGPRKIPQGYDD